MFFFCVMLCSLQLYSIKLTGRCIYFRECWRMEVETAHASPKRQWTGDYVEGKKGHAWFWSTCPTGRSNGFAQVLHGPSYIIVLHMLCPLLMIIYIMAAVSIPESSCLVRSPCLIIDQTLMTKDLKERYAELLICPSSLKIELCIYWLKCLLYRYLYLLACKEKLMRCLQTILRGREQTVRTFLMLPSQDQAAQTVSRLMKASMSSRIIRHQQML